MADTLEIKATKGFRNIDTAELWNYRELMFFFAWRDISVRYKQTVLGVLWALLQPAATMIVFAVFFGKFGKLPSDGVPYPVFVYAGLLPWTLVSSGLSRAADSVLGNSGLIKKVYFPRLIIPLAASAGALVDFFVSVFLLAGLMLWFHVGVDASILLLPFLVAMTFFASLGIGFFFAAVNALYRDVRYVLPFVLQMGMFVTPVIYPVSMVPKAYAWLLYFNPMCGIIEAIRWVLFKAPAFPVLGLCMSACVIAAFLVLGIVVFASAERHFADNV